MERVTSWGIALFLEEVNTVRGRDSRVADRRAVAWIWTELSVYKKSLEKTKKILYNKFIRPLLSSEGGKLY